MKYYVEVDGLFFCYLDYLSMRNAVEYLNVLRYRDSDIFISYR